MDKRAPGIEPKTAVDAILDTCSPYYVGNFPLTIRQFDAKSDPISWLMVYIAIAGHTNKRTGKAYPGRDRIAELVGISPRQVTRITHLLEERGLIKITRMPAKNGKGFQNVYRVIHDPTLTDADIKSIHSPDVSDIQRVSNKPGSSVTHSMSHGNQAVTSTPKNGKPVSDIQGVTLTSLTSSTSHELLEHKNIQDTSIKTAEQAISLWLAYAWKHGQHQPIADDDDLATAHKLVASSITADQLEHAIIQDPEADSLQPVVRHLIP